LRYSLEEDVVTQVIVIIEVFVPLGEGEDALLELAVLGVDDFVLITVVFEELGGPGEEIEFFVDFTQEQDTAIRAHVSSFEIGLNFPTLAA
jgi:hypothetical protein